MMPSLDELKAAVAALADAVTRYETEVVAEAARVPTLADVKALVDRVS